MGTDSSNHFLIDAINLATPDLIRAGRALAHLSARELSEKSGVSLPTIQRLEGAEDVGHVKVETLRKLLAALDAEGVEIITLPDGRQAVSRR